MDWSNVQGLWNPPGKNGLNEKIVFLTCYLKIACGSQQDKDGSLL